MEKHYKLTDKEFEQQFEFCKLNPLIFSHEAHLRLAWIHISKYGLEKAIRNIQLQLLNYTKYLGQRAKYNKTLTIASLKTVDHFMRISEANSFKELIFEFPSLKHNFNALIKVNYGEEMIYSKLVKPTYLESNLTVFQ